MQFYYFQVIPFWYFYLSQLLDHVITVTNENPQGWLMFFKRDSDNISDTVDELAVIARALNTIAWIFV